MRDGCLSPCSAFCIAGNNAAGGCPQVQLGAEEAVDSQRGLTYRISWAQDDSGALQVSTILQLACSCRTGSHTAQVFLPVQADNRQPETAAGSDAQVLDWQIKPQVPS